MIACLEPHIGACLALASGWPFDDLMELLVLLYICLEDYCCLRLELGR
jgi:hypothetical protein